MPRARSGSRTGGYNEFWPGYVDVLSTLLLVFTFLLSIFMIAQYFVSQEASDKDTALQRLNRQIAELTNLLSLERQKTQSIDNEIEVLRATLAQLQLDNTDLESTAKASEDKARAASAQVTNLSSQLSKERKISSEALARVNLLNQQLMALRRQIAALNDALEASERRDQQSQVKIKNLGSRLNAALVRQVRELRRYRSDFFGRLRELLKGRKDIRIVGDRFVFQSEVLFPSGKTEMLAEGRAALNELARAILELASAIPKELNWAIQVDGHTDIKPIKSSSFASNWELSTARSISVVRYLISRGVPPERLVAAGYGEFQPLDPAQTDEALRRNRRIELKLTNR